VFRSNQGVSAQLIDDVSGRTLAAVSWFEPELRSLAKSERAKRAGETLAERAKGAGVSEAVFDRGGYRYHGHVRAFAEAIREAGIAV
jgi:large subunit ribosomal protein L18